MNPERHSPVRFAVFVGLAVALAALTGGYFASRALLPFRAAPRPVAWDAGWIQAGTHAYGGYFRTTLDLPTAPRHAWLRLAAYDAFELCVNGNPVSHSYLWRPTRPFQNGLSELGQRIRGDPPLLYLNYPREYQWTGHAEHRVPVYVDLSPYLRAGRNVLAVKIESRAAPARFIAEGAIHLGPEMVLPLRTGPGWRASLLPPTAGQPDWNDPALDDRTWAPAEPAPAPSGGSLTLFPEEVFAEPFAAAWLQTGATTGTTVLARNFTVPAGSGEVWLRLRANRSYELLLNGERVNAPTSGATDLSTGDWLIGTQSGLDLISAPELLDPDEVGQLFVGQRFITPRHSDPTDDDFHPYENQQNRTHDRPTAAGRIAPQEDKPGRALPQVAPEDFRPGTRTPLALTQPRSLSAYDAYQVTSLLRAGENRLELQLRPDPSPLPLNFGPEAAVEIWRQGADGRAIRLGDDTNWTAQQVAANGAAISVPVSPAPRAGTAHASGTGALAYRGYVYSHPAKLLSWGLLIAAHVALAAGLTGQYLRRRQFSAAAWTRLGTAALLPLSVNAAVLILYWCFYERSEGTLFLHARTWGLAYLAGLAVTVVGWRLSRTAATGDRAGCWAEWLATLPARPLWGFLLAWVLLLTFAVRAYRLDFQTIDDDEYASIQASLAIAEQGVPAYNADVWYTRSPLYHYASGTLIRLAGANLWTLRLPGVVLAVATAWLVYRLGARMLRSRWTGLGAMLLFALHPLMIFSAHIARFYQQQQFFALLTVYAFLRGFVDPAGPRTMAWRYGTLAAYLGAILSQELSLVIGFQLALGYILFAARRPWPDELRLLVVAAAVIAVTAVDLALFQVRTLTRVEGISPNVEATLAPNFTSPLNYLAVFIGYSRLHLGLSLLLFAGLPFVLKSRERPVLAVAFFLFSGVACTNLLVTGQSIRYQYWLMPLWILLGLHTLTALLGYLGDFLRARPDGAAGDLRRIAPLVAGILFAAVLASWSPWRIAGSHDTKLLGDASGAFQFIRAHLLPGDAVAATEPHPHGALLETGRCDYDLAMPLLYDFVYLKDGVLRDRNANAEVISTVAQLQAACARHSRLWIAVNREKFRSRGDNLRWEYPGARAELFLRKNCTVVHETYLWTVFLWDASTGHYSPFATDWAR